MIGDRDDHFALVTFVGPESLPRLPTTPFASRKIIAAYAHVYDFRESIHTPMMVDLDVCAVIASDQETYRVTAQMRVPSSQIAALAFIKGDEVAAWLNSVETLPELGVP